MQLVEGSYGYKGPAGQYSGKIRLFKKPWVQDEGGRYVVNRSSDPRVFNPEVKSQVRDLLRVVGIVAPFCVAGFQYSWKICFIEIPGLEDEGGRHLVKRSSEPRIAHTEVKVQVRDKVRVVGIVAPFAPWGFRIRVKFVLSSPRG